jgi:hypothetical protein
VTQKAERMLGDRYERPEGSGKAPMEPEAAFMQVISDMLASQRTMSQSLAQVADRLAMVGIPGTQAPHAAQGNSGQAVDPRHLLAHTHLRVGFPDHGSLVFRGHHHQQHNSR